MAVTTQQRVFWGLSTDTKPTVDPDNPSRPLGTGARFYEIDTGNTFDWNGAAVSPAWISSLTSAAGGTQTVRSQKGTGVNSAAAPTTSAAQCLAVNASRIKALIYNAGSQTVYLGKTSGVTVSGVNGGIPVVAGGSLEDSSTTSTWFAITATGTGDLRIIEVS